ncbi:hypothetical protein AB6B38_06820 [Glycocaulis abyssi]|uniref:EF-hand domain-containing protein n=1 Tax=Glycocaulis abyssi TaxID=1433403 RepID=A0ABV9N7R4_9PROT
MKTSLKFAAAALALGFTSVPVMSVSAVAAEAAVQESAAGERGERRGHRWGHRGTRGNPEAFAERLASIDADGDGVITRAEFLAHHNTMFDRMDANDDGVINAADRELMRERWAERRAERGAEGGERRRQWGQRGGERRERADREITRAEFEARGNAMFDRWAGEGNDSVTVAAVQERMAEMRAQRGERGERGERRQRRSRD